MEFLWEFIDLQVNIEIKRNHLAMKNNEETSKDTGALKNFPGNYCFRSSGHRIFSDAV